MNTRTGPRIVLVDRVLRAIGTALGARVRRAGYLQKWLTLGAAIGVIAGLGAVVFYSALSLATHVFLGLLVGYHVPTPVGEGNVAGSLHPARPWALPVVTALGGLLSAIVVFTLAPEAEGHGTDAAINAVHTNPRGIRMRAVVVKIVASALTIGSGGSGGREGPTAQISAGFASLLARVLHLTPEDGRVAVSVGIGSGIGAIFGAPLGGAVLTADIVYRDDFETAALIPGLIASTIAYTVFGLFETFNPLFGSVDPTYQFVHPLRLLWYALIGVAAGVVGLAYAKGFYGIAAISQRLPGSRVLKPAIGGLAVGSLALVMPQVLGTGYGWIQKALGPQLLALPLWIVLALPLARILATGLSIGTGGSGGIFGPGMVIGAFTGAAVWRLLEPIAPSIPHDPAPFVIVGMMACFGAIARAPLAVMLMVAEMTGSLAVIPPAMVAVGIAYLIVRRNDDTIYRSQPKSKAETASSRLQFGLPLLTAIPVADAMGAPRVVLDEHQSVSAALNALTEAHIPGAPVTDDHGHFMGTVDRTALALAANDRPSSPLSQEVDPTAPSVQPSLGLDHALEALTTGGGWVTVIDAEHHVTGIVATSDLVGGYHRALSAMAGQLARVAGNANAMDVEIASRSPLIGHALRDLTLPDGTVIVSVQRDDKLLFANGDTVLHAGDRASVLTRPERFETVRRLLSGDQAPAR